MYRFSKKENIVHGSPVLKIRTVLSARTLFCIYCPLSMLKNITNKEKTNKQFPQNVFDQLFGSISAVFLSWESNRAKVYRKLNQIPSEWGTAVNVQSMVFGNMGNDSATGVVFTRNPSDGANEIYGEYLVNAQGEDVVAGTRTPQYLSLIHI